MPTTKYVWDDDNLLYETDGDDVVTVEYTYSPGQYGELISEYRNGTTFTHYTDAQGSTVALTNDAGTVTDTFLYNAWGEEVARTGTTPTPFRWIGALGYYWDSDRQMYYIRRRDYSGPQGRWTSVDPIGYLTGLNLYDYCHSNPLAFQDPMGLVVFPGGPKKKGPGSCKNNKPQYPPCNAFPYTSPKQVIEGYYSLPYDKLIEEGSTAATQCSGGPGTGVHFNYWYKDGSGKKHYCASVLCCDCCEDQVVSGSPIYVIIANGWCKGNPAHKGDAKKCLALIS